MVPDFEYFMRAENRSHFSHTLPGIFWFDLPLALFTCFLFHNVARGPLLLNLPQVLQSRLMRLYKFNWNAHFQKNWKIVLYSILIGIFTHLISDRLTHKSSNLVISVPGLIDNQELLDNPKSIYRVVQIIYSVIGLGLCLFTVWQMPRDNDTNSYKPDIRYWVTLFCVFAVTLFMIILKQGFERVDLIVGSISSLFVGFLAVSLIFQPRGRLQLSR